MNLSARWLAGPARAQRVPTKTVFVSEGFATATRQCKMSRVLGSAGAVRPARRFGHVERPDIRHIPLRKFVFRGKDIGCRIRADELFLINKPYYPQYLLCTHFSHITPELSFVAACPAVPTWPWKIRQFVLTILFES